MTLTRRSLEVGEAHHLDLDVYDHRFGAGAYLGTHAARGGAVSPIGPPPDSRDRRLRNRYGLGSRQRDDTRR